jgi:hypothetical protein
VKSVLVMGCFVVLALSLIMATLIEYEFSCCNPVMKLERREAMSTERFQMEFLISEGLGEL